MLQKVTAGVQCSVCLATWTRPPRISCPGVRLFRGWETVPETLKTRTGWAREGVRITDDASPRAMIDTPVHDRYALFEREQGREIRRRTKAGVA
jgi:hypothetical protein